MTAKSTTLTSCRSLRRLAPRFFENWRFLVLLGLFLPTTSCMVGPKYQRPSASVPGAYKELPPPDAAQASNWKQAQPNDSAARGKWWEIFNEPQLNALEEQVNISNQNVLAAEAQFRAARDAVRVARSSLFPSIGTAPSYTNSRTSETLFNVRAGNLTSGQRNIYDLPVDLSYQADVRETSDAACEEARSPHRSQPHNWKVRD